MLVSFSKLLLSLCLFRCQSFVPLTSQRKNSSWNHVGISSSASYYRSSFSVLQGKKANRKGAGKKKGGQQPQEKKSVQDARFDAQTRQFMFTMVGLTKTLPDKSKTILKDINLSFYPGAKIGVIGLNGSGKSTLMKIMAGVDTEFDGKSTDHGRTATLTFLDLKELRGHSQELPLDIYRKSLN